VSVPIIYILETDRNNFSTAQRRALVE